MQSKLWDTKGRRAGLGRDTPSSWTLSCSALCIKGNHPTGARSPPPAGAPVFPRSTVQASHVFSPHVVLGQSQERSIYKDLELGIFTRTSAAMKPSSLDTETGSGWDFFPFSDLCGRCCNRNYHELHLKALPCEAPHEAGKCVSCGSVSLPGAHPSGVLPDWQARSGRLGTGLARRPAGTEWPCGHCPK